MNTDTTDQKKAKELTQKILRILTVECCPNCEQPKFPRDMQPGDETKIGWSACVNEQCVAHGYQQASAAYRLVPRVSKEQREQIESLLLPEKGQGQQSISLGRKVYRGGRFIVIAAILTLLMWHGVHGNRLEWNLFIFMQWMGTLSWGLIYSAKNEPKYLKPPPPVLPLWVPKFSDFAIALTLAAYGHFFYACLTIAQMMFEAAYWEHRAKSQEPKATA